jgi:hypothetical protein
LWITLWNNRAGELARKAVFVEKKYQKRLRGCRWVVRDSRAKVFASFFKKKRLPWLS